MGNRAVLAFSKEGNAVGIYLHWNGGPESIEKFLTICRERGYRDPTADATYAMARLIGAICEALPGETGVGVGKLSELDVDNWDNGAYLIGEGWKVVDRWGKGYGREG